VSLPPPGLLAYTGALAALPAEARRRLLERSTSQDARVRERVAGILSRVRQEGDAALRAFAREFDGVQLEALEVPRAALTRALDGLAPEVRRALSRAADNIARAHAAFLPAAVEVETEPGVVVGRRPDPLGRVGLYAPGGRAAYPSSVLMGAVPARVAGVRERVLCSPPGKDGRPSPVVLAAAAIAEVDRVFALGGAGAVGALAFGTESVPRVDRIVGPGNAYVAEAKLQVAGYVAIDAPAGPSELLAIADGKASARVVAREMAAQAEHDPEAAVVALVQGEALAAAVVEALAEEVAAAPRRALMEQALAARGAVLTVPSLEEAWPFAEAFAAEHLLLAVERPEEALPRVRNAGTVFVGERASVAFGDYLTGANHTLPTGGLARSYSGLSTLDFIRWTTWQRVSPEAARRLSADTATLATSEGLFAHAQAARTWGEDSR
jgi:histidinol dehydrogenase